MKAETHRHRSIGASEKHRFQGQAVWLKHHTHLEPVAERDH